MSTIIEVNNSNKLDNKSFFFSFLVKSRTNENIAIIINILNAIVESKNTIMLLYIYYLIIERHTKYSDAFSY